MCCDGSAAEYRALQQTLLGGLQMLLEFCRGRRRAVTLGGTALLALLNGSPPARAQDQPPANPPAQTQAPQESPAAPTAPAPPAQAPSAPAPAPQIRGGSQLPEINVFGARRPAPRAVARRTAPARTAPTTTVPPVSPAEALTQRSNSLDQARSDLYTTIGTTSDTITHQTIEELPQGANASVEKVLLQAPGVSQDSAASGLLHVRNDHANVAFRINGVMLPDGVTGFGSIFDTRFIGTASLVTGALPAEYGMRTVGLVDITTRNDIFNNTGSINYYFGSRETIQPSFEYGGTFGANCPSANSALPTKAPPSSSANCFGGVQYYFTGSYLQTNEGIENSTPFLTPVNDFSRQERGFAYMSTFLDPYTRLSLIASTYNATFEVPNVFNAPLFPGIATPVFGFSNFDSSKLNERQNEQTQFGVLALQRSVNGFDGQFSYFTRYNDLHFIPDPAGDLLINGIASDISRQSYTNGFQGDASYAINPAHTLRAGFTVSAEQIWVDNTSLVEAAPGGVPTTPADVLSITDDVAKLGWLAGVYAQDEWKITNQLTLNAGLRFDQMWQFVDANQLSPRASLIYKPFDGTTFHAGYARYFTPPVLVEAAPANIALFNNTTGQAPNTGTSPVLPERSHYFDTGLDQKIVFGCTTSGLKDCTTLDLGLDAYYKIAKDLIDNGQFGQALVLSAFNYAQGVAQGVEFSAKYHSGNFQAYANLAASQEKATQPVSNQYLFNNTTPLTDLGGLTQFQYLSTHWIYTDHNQFVTGSAGLSYKWNGTTFSTDMIYGSGLRNGDANIDALAPYAQFNVGIARDFDMPDHQPVTVRFDVVNIFDTIYQIRNGTGIGVFAPQYGPRRGYFIGIKKKICADPNSGDCRNLAQNDRRDYASAFKWPSAPVFDRYNWSGFYLGLNAGGVFTANTATISGGGGSASVNERGFIGGAQFGANYQTGPMVWGFEADYDASTQNQSLPAGVLSGSTSAMPWLATLRGRFGVAFDRTLVYGTAGGAAGELKSMFAIPAGTTSTTVTDGTWTAGGGIEYGLTDHLSARVEYLYLGKGNIATGVIGSPATTITSRVQDNLVRAALNYRFSVW
jgi:opacity protein-like surface antigen/outer membrane receptor protein involved in Fe transport